MAVIKQGYGTAGAAITCTLTSLASGSYRSSAAIDNSINLWLDAEVFLQIKTASSGLVAPSTIVVYAYGSVDAGTNYTDSMPGTNVAVTPTAPGAANLKFVGQGLAPTISTTYNLGPFSIASAFGYMPQTWGIVVLNNTGATFDAAVASAWYQGLFNTAV